MVLVLLVGSSSATVKTSALSSWFSAQGIVLLTHEPAIFSAIMLGLTPYVQLGVCCCARPFSLSNKFLAVSPHLSVL